MPSSKITISSKPIKPHKSFSCPDFKAKAAHVTDKFQFVDMWLRQSDANGKKALVYWRQAASFFRANGAVDDLAKPLTSYYHIFTLYARSNETCRQEFLQLLASNGRIGG